MSRKLGTLGSLAALVVVFGAILFAAIGDAVLSIFRERRT